MDAEHKFNNTLAISVFDILNQPFMKTLAIIVPILMICGDAVITFIGFMHGMEECAGEYAYENSNARIAFDGFFKYGGIAGCIVGLMNVFPKLLKFKCNGERVSEVKCKSFSCLYHWSTGDGYLAIFIFLWVVFAFIIQSEMNHGCRTSNPALLLRVWCAIKIVSCFLGACVLCVAAIVAANSGPKYEFD